jgi:hypothetical protein
MFTQKVMLISVHYCSLCSLSLLPAWLQWGGSRGSWCHKNTHTHTEIAGIPRAVLRIMWRMSHTVSQSCNHLSQFAAWPLPSLLHWCPPMQLEHHGPFPFFVLVSITSLYAVFVSGHPAERVPGQGSDQHWRENSKSLIICFTSTGIQRYQAFQILECCRR